MFLELIITLYLIVIHNHSRLFTVIEPKVTLGGHREAIEQFDRAAEGQMPPKIRLMFKLVLLRFASC